MVKKYTDSVIEIFSYDKDNDDLGVRKNEMLSKLGFIKLVHTDTRYIFMNLTHFIVKCPHCFLV